MIPKLQPVGCDICSTPGNLHYIGLGGGQYDTFPVSIGGTERRKTRVCHPCGTTILKDIVSRVIPSS